MFHFETKNDYKKCIKLVIGKVAEKDSNVSIKVLIVYSYFTLTENFLEIGLL